MGRCGRQPVVVRVDWLPGCLCSGGRSLPVQGDPLAAE
ncbi:hypothetical protein LHK_00488 [Laribacter hongkongensis HLHK9]|uniref:Uncharacterized protein n=1 Tax=Laribacter hongkongensis (strain HLHK9) TaxID=557598 RepID=C1DC64_LARHH|nr:hypothetical protein LHK_00488 [Laribacter hongkongensis HLHK9]